MKPNALVTVLLLAAANLCSHAMPATSQGAGGTAVQGEVLEVKDVEGYTYLRLKTKDGETWAAVATAPVKKGSTVSIANPMVMRNFESKSLKKTFDVIVFGSIADANTKPGAAPMSATAPHGGVAAAAAAVVKVAKATGPEARTVAEVVDGKAALKGKPVLVRGQVVKVSNGILGKNWVHLQDGSGSAAKGSNDILVTTKDKVAVGDVVNAKGVVKTDVDLGSGYTYAVMIEDASLQAR
ncbi:MAG: nucleotide-binding protein [Ideonella sp.]|nr:nucleotide-binding protein [Ideonella sp.]